MKKDWIECWVVTALAIVIAIIGWIGNDPELAGNAIAVAILLPAYKWYYSQN